MDTSTIAPGKFYFIYLSAHDPDPIDPSKFEDGMQAFGKKDSGSTNFFVVTFVSGYGWVESADAPQARRFLTST